VPDAALEPSFRCSRPSSTSSRVEFASSGDALVSLEAKPNFRALGKKFGKKTPLAAQAVSAFNSDQLRSFLRGEPAGR
jgi:isoleucyl-tRNA synthetase